MIWFVGTIHVIVCIVLIGVVLLQQGKSADLAGAFGGQGSQTAFGPRGAANLLTKVTTWAAIVFMFTSIGLTVLIQRSSGARSVLSGIKSTQTTPARLHRPPSRARSLSGKAGYVKNIYVRAKAQYPSRVEGPAVSLPFSHRLGRADRWNLRDKLCPYTGKRPRIQRPTATTSRPMPRKTSKNTAAWTRTPPYPSTFTSIKG